MYGYVLRRLGLLLPTLAGVSVLVFLMIYLVPGDPAQIMLGERADAATVAALSGEDAPRQAGEDQPPGLVDSGNPLDFTNHFFIIALCPIGQNHMTRQSRRRLFWLSVGLFLLIAPPIIFYTTGWRLTSDFKVKRTGGLFVAVSEAESDVYLEGKFEKKTNFFQSGVFVQNLTPGPYSVLVSKDGFWPWAKVVQVSESGVAETKAMTLSQNIGGKVLLSGPFESVYASGSDKILLLEEKKGQKYNLTFYDPDKNEFLSPANSSSKTLISNSDKIKAASGSIRKNLRRQRNGF